MNGGPGPERGLVVAPRARVLADAAGPAHALAHGPRRPARVVAATRYAVHLATDRTDLPALAVVRPDAIRTPNAAVLRGPAAPWPAPGTPAAYGEGEIRLGALTVRVGTTPWSAPRVHGLLAAGARADRLAELARAVRTRPLDPACATPLRVLRRALRENDDEAVRRAARTLLGRGPGLTPSGDDILCGVLLAAHALGAPAPGIAAEVTAPGAVARTPLVSLALLRHAVRGECVPQAASLLRGLAAPYPLDPAPLLAVGHHSGTDLARGLLAGLTARR